MKVDAGRAPPELVEGGTRVFLVKVLNQAGRDRAPGRGEPEQRAACPRRPGRSGGSPEPPETVTRAGRPRAMGGHLALPHRSRRWASGCRGLGGLPDPPGVSRDRGTALGAAPVQRGPGHPGHRLPQRGAVLFDALPAHPVKLRVRDESGRPAMASFLIRDRLERVYPSPSKRLAPDFPFQPQVYRKDGDDAAAARGRLHRDVLARARIPRRDEPSCGSDGPTSCACRLERWIDPVEARLVFRRPPHPRGRLLPLRQARRRGSSRRTCGRRSRERR